MYTQLKTLSLLALAGSAVAAPQGGWGNWAGKYWGGNKGGSESAPSATATNVAVVTAYTTVTYGGNWGKPTATPTAAPVVSEIPKASPSSEAPAASSPAAPVSGSSGGYMDVVSQWRSKMGLSALTEDSKLAGNALKTADDGNGEMKHELNPGSFAQVLAPGSSDEFEKVFVGGWLCERPDLAGLDGICSSMSAGWSYGGETGHADILVSGSYSKIGCGLADGIWACDLA